MSEHTVDNDVLRERIRAVLRLISPEHITPLGRRQIERVLAEPDAPIPPAENDAGIRQREAAAFNQALAQVVVGVEDAIEAHRAHGHRQIVAALSGLLVAVPRTENPYRTRPNPPEGTDHA